MLNETIKVFHAYSFCIRLRFIAAVIRSEVVWKAQMLNKIPDWMLGGGKKSLGRAILICKKDLFLCRPDLHRLLCCQTLSCFFKIGIDQRRCRRYPIGAINENKIHKSLFE